LVINELIKRDPFNRELYKIRILVNSNLGRIELVKKDSLMLTNFAEGYSIDEIVKTN
jgi:acyl CoA:acetate/3-ketoacid CoA transferase beta subunit